MLMINTLFLFIKLSSRIKELLFRLSLVQKKFKRRNRKKSRKGRKG
jgi:hypothetical protein